MILIAVSAAFFYFLAGGKTGLLKMYRLHREVKQIEQEIKSSRVTIDSLIIVIEKLKNDTAYIEKVAREKLGMARKNEKVYKFVEEN